MSGEGLIIFLAISISFILIVAKLSSLAEKTRINSEREELMREIIRRTVQKRRIDELYGRERKDENR